MAVLLKQSTAATVKIGPFLDSGDGVTAETGLTIQKADVRLSKNGGNMAAASADQGASDAGAAHDELGYYDISLDTTDTNTAGSLKVMISESGALPVWGDFMVLPANVYDSLVGGTDTLNVDAAGIANGAITAAAIATGAVDADALATDAVTEIVNGVLTTAMTESYSTLNGTKTLAQALYELVQRQHNAVISGNTLTVYKVDGSTLAYTITLDDAGNPAAIERAS